MTLFSILMLLNFSIVYSLQSPQNWIDPHEIVTTDTSVFNPESCSSSCDEDKLTLTHYKRVINLLLNLVTVNRNDFTNYSGQLTIQMSTDAYDYLKDFARSSVVDAAALRKVDSILTNSFTKTTKEYLFDSVVSWTDHLYFNFYNRTTGILLFLMFMCVISYKLLRANLNIWTVTGYLIFIGWIVDFAFTWMKLYQEAEIDKMADTLRYSSVPPNCDPNKMSIWSYIWSTLSTDTECRNYHHTMYKDHFWSIAPLTVFSHQFGIVILTPASHIGKALGSFSASLLDVLPFYAKILVFPLLLIFTAILICIIFSFLTNTSFGFNLLHVIQFNFGSSERRVISDSLSGENLRCLLNTIQRDAIENVAMENVNVKSDSCKSCQNELKNGQITGRKSIENSEENIPDKVCEGKLTTNIAKENDHGSGNKKNGLSSTENVNKDEASKLCGVPENVENIVCCAGYSLNEEDSKMKENDENRIPCDGSGDKN